MEELIGVVWHRKYSASPVCEVFVSVATLEKLEQDGLILFRGSTRNPPTVHRSVGHLSRSRLWHHADECPLQGGGA